MRRHLVLCGGLVLALICLSSARGQAQMRGEVDWDKGVVTVMGVGVPKEGVSRAQARILAERAAEVNAYRGLAEFLRGVHVTSETTVEDAMVKDDHIRARVDVMIKGARQVGRTVYDEDGVARVSVAISLRDNLADALLPEEGFSPGDSVSVETPDASPASGITGLIVDASGLGLVPAIAPKIVDETGQVVYGARIVSREAAVQNGMAAYGKDLETARKNDRVGSNPLVIKGTRAEGKNKTNLVISSADAQRVREAVEGRTFLNQCRLVFVVD